jgi:kynurenine 3-monooxygenase
MNADKKDIAIIGAGLIGSLMSIYLARRGYRVSVYERRPDPRKLQYEAGRSINLALSNRGIKALEDVGIMSAVRKMAIPMHGRMMHDLDGNLTFQPYGKEGQSINSVSRGKLNELLLDAAEQKGVDFYFDHRCIQADLTRTDVRFQLSDGTIKNRSYAIVIGADGAFSIIRNAFQITDRFDYSQYYIHHGYKELTIPASHGKNLDRHALHIWPRQSFMMIALPNADMSFTCTLFLPYSGNDSFDQIHTGEQVIKFFENRFPDAVGIMPDLIQDFDKNPTSSLVTIKCYPWVRNRTVLLGDAAHAIVPFYGQGMNAGFEDCRLLNQFLEDHSDNWGLGLESFQKHRKPDTDAIAQLALDNFVEMRDLVADDDFLLRKKIEARLNALYPDIWIPLYAMVTFNESIRYADAQKMGMKQKAIMDEVMRCPNIAQHWEEIDFRSIVDKLL